MPRRVNFMVAFGARERIRGGAGHDKLGSRGSANQVHGGPGNDLLHGGRGDVLDGGAGNDLIIDTEGGATVRGGPGRDRVIRARPRRPADACGGLAHDALVYADRSDTIAPSCRRHHSRVLYRPVSTVAPRPGLAAQLAVSGDGSNGNPSLPANRRSRADAMTARLARTRARKDFTPREGSMPSPTIVLVAERHDALRELPAPAGTSSGATSGVTGPRHLTSTLDGRAGRLRRKLERAGAIGNGLKCRGAGYSVLDRVAAVVDQGQEPGAARNAAGSPVEPRGVRRAA
jgi:Ca2+-binding RTX toxin-like protein